MKWVEKLSDVEVIATGRSIRELSRLRKKYGEGRWRKMKCAARIKLDDGVTFDVELHWYEAHGIGQKEFKIKRFLDDEK